MFFNPSLLTSLIKFTIYICSTTTDSVLASSTKLGSIFSTLIRFDRLCTKQAFIYTARELNSKAIYKFHLTKYMLMNKNDFRMCYAL